MFLDQEFSYFAPHNILPIAPRTLPTPLSTLPIPLNTSPTFPKAFLKKPPILEKNPCFFTGRAGAEQAGGWVEQAGGPG